MEFKKLYNFLSFSSSVRQIFRVKYQSRGICCRNEKRLRHFLHKSKSHPPSVRDLSGSPEEMGDQHFDPTTVADNEQRAIMHTRNGGVRRIPYQIVRDIYHLSPLSRTHLSRQTLVHGVMQVSCAQIAEIRRCYSPFMVLRFFARV